MRYSILLGLFIVAVLLINTGSRIHMISLGYEIEDYLEILHDLKRGNKELLLEREALSGLDRIERIASQTLGMIRPGPQQLIYVDVPGEIGWVVGPAPNFTVVSR